MEARQKDLTILFVDVSDSTRLYEMLGDAAAFREVRGCLEIFGQAVANHKGRVVKTIGDGALCVFPDADCALLAACDMQARIQERQSTSHSKISIRIGLHHGPVLVDGDDVYGDTVNTASRMAQVAATGQIITTGETVARLSQPYRNSTRRLDALSVRGKHDEVTVHSVAWQTGCEQTQMPGRIETTPGEGGGVQLRLAHAGREIFVSTVVSIGRNPGSDIHLKDGMASRAHARIERRKDKFVLIDQSSNGTFVRMKSGEEYRLLREEMFLHSSGAITFGHSARDKIAEIVGFWCESGSAARTVSSAVLAGRPQWRGY